MQQHPSFTDKNTSRLPVNSSLPLFSRPVGISDSLWELVQQPFTGEANLHVLTFSDGNLSHTRVEIVANNNPTLIDDVCTALAQQNLSVVTIQLKPVWTMRNQEGLLETLLESNLSHACNEEVIIQVDLASEERPEKLVEIESLLKSSMRTWTQDLQGHLKSIMGYALAEVWSDQYAVSFPLRYQENYSTLHAVEDIQHIMQLNHVNESVIRLYRLEGEEKSHFHLKWFHLNRSLPLSTMIPLLENLGLEVISARPYEMNNKKDYVFYINEFFVHYHGRKELELESAKPLLEEALSALWHEFADNDGMNRLILSVGLAWRQVVMLRSYSKYFAQIKLGFSGRYIESVLMHHPETTIKLVNLFDERFNPAGQEGAEQREQLLLEEINEDLEALDNLDEDRILRRYLDMIQGTVRTNFYQLNAQGKNKSYISYKFLPRTIPDLPKPLPFYEIFVYSPQMEGLHLRSGKISRGGVRCSDRPEDYRTEILALMKAQQVKNSALVPMGAAGGFIAKNISEWMSEEQQKQVVMEGYGTFIAGLLDITDNLQDNQVISPERVICKDDEDYYLVVSDDKGTTDFADMANAISIARKFWLKDAFASGGSVGYDHKKIGISARGVWVAIEHHMRELGLQEGITIVGIGNMSSDVFGNGMLLSDKIQLVAAFDQSHIFIDPNPDSAVSFKERQRLFNLPNSTWADYDKSLISAGGGVFSRHAKTIQTTSAMRLKLQIGGLRLTPNELIHYLLKAPVDVLWNGSVGTYIKSTIENHTEIADKTNDVIRVDGAAVQAKIIAEGGNLGVTQLGRIEYAMRNGLSNTDFFDNSAGVDCSDHEVNLKILLQDLMREGIIDNAQRKEILINSAEEVMQLVLLNVNRQIQAVSMATVESNEKIEDYRRYIDALIIEGKLDRELEYIPSGEEIERRKLSGSGLTRPELAVLLAYCKNDLKEELMASEVPDDPYVARELLRMFPNFIVENYFDQLTRHQLKREIIATHVANHLVNFMGVTFVHRIKESSSASIPEIIKAYIAARDIFHLESFWQTVEAMQASISEVEKRKLLLAYTQLVCIATSWVLANYSGKNIDVAECVTRYASGVDLISKELALLLVGERAEIWEARFAEYKQLGVDEELALLAAGIEGMSPVLAILQTAESAQQPILSVAKVFYELGDRLNLYWFSQQLNQLPTENHWQALAKEGYRDELERQQRRLTSAILLMNDGQQNVAQADEVCQTQIRSWLNQYQQSIHRWRMMTHEFELSTPDFAMYAVALRELSRLAKE